MRVGVVGASGYTGLELIKILLLHPEFELTFLFATSKEVIEKVHPSLKDVVDLVIEQVDLEKINKLDLVFVALPHKSAMSLIKEIKTKVVDLSADYRLKKENYEKFYTKHIDLDGLSKAVYGLTDFFEDKIKKARIVANPGCYPTSVLIPLLALKDFVASKVVVDAKSGVSGAGKKLSETTHFVKVNENIFSYNALIHRHQIEMEEKSGLKIKFVPNLIPITRGMQSNIYFEINKEIDVFSYLKDFFKDEEFIRVREELVEVKNVAGTHFIDISIRQDGNFVFISSVIDNLLRGASSMAVANANLMMGLDKNLAMPKVAYVP